MTTPTFHKVSPPVYFASWSTTPPADPLPDDGPGDPIPGDPGYEYVLLDTVQTRFDQRRCLNCGGTHRTWQCAEIGDMLFAR
jgi:hypothetical protein